MKSIIMKAHEHDGSTRLTIPKEIIKARGWEKEGYYTFFDWEDGTISLAPTSRTSTPTSLYKDNNGELSVNKT